RPHWRGGRSPGKARVGTTPGSIRREGRVGLVSRRGTLTYEVVQALTDAGIGQSTCVGIGGDPVAGSSFIDILKLFKDDADTDGIVLMGEIGGGGEEGGAALRSAEPAGRAQRGLIGGPAAPP